MPDYKYLIIGGGMTAAAAVAGIREGDHDGSIGVVSTEAHPPYNRPPLSKTLWKGDSLDSIWRKIDGNGVTSHVGRTVQSLDRENRRVVDDQNTSYTYDKLLLATGCRTRRLPFGGDDIVYFRTVDDYLRLRDMTTHGDRLAIIGGGFIGSELAASLAAIGKHPVLMFPADTIGSRMYPPELAAHLNGVYAEQGVEVMSRTKVTGCERRGSQFVLRVSDGDGGAERDVTVDGVVAGVGVEPNVELAQTAGLVVDDGIRVDASLCTNDPNIYAAGDVASSYDVSLGKWRRVEHADNAGVMGGYAGVAMSGRAVAYDHLPFFYSDFFDLGYEAVGEVDSRLQMVSDWKVKFREGVVYYLRDGQVRGVLLWNIWGQLDAARRLVAASETLRAEDLVGRYSSSGIAR